MPWSDDLSEGSPAHAIAASKKTRVRVVAGPGTGKSFAMKRRVARLLEEGVAPSTILPVTFTRVAAEDLHRELVGMGTAGCDELRGTTLHGLAMRILMRNHVLQSTGRTARPLNDFELEPLLADLADTYGGKRQTKKLIKAFEAAWARLQHEQPGNTQSHSDKAFHAALLSWLRFHNAMLIGEVIPILYQYLRSNPMADERKEYAHILVDEFQDLNRAEQGVVSLLSDAAQVCIVGDDDQSIYSFKHAHPDGIVDWVKDNPGADDLELVDCRRCPALVVEMANSLIESNQVRPVPKTLTAIAENGEGIVRILQYSELTQEISGVASMVHALVKNGTPPGDILILAQRGAIGTPIYDALMGKGVPVKSYYSESELDSIPAQRAFSLLKLFADKQDRVALRWLVGFSGSNWNAAGYRRVRSHCESSGLTPWDALSALAQGSLSISHTKNIVIAFNELNEILSELEQAPDFAAVVDIVLPESEPALSALRGLAIETLKATDSDDRQQFLRALSEAVSQPEIPDEVTEVRIMSLHKSKGLSAPVTIISGCVEGLLPKQPEAGVPMEIQQQQLEEQRRLFYVGITRVKSSPKQQKPGTLILTYSRSMPTKTALGSGIAPASQAYGLANLNASRFIAELGASAPTPEKG